MGIKILLCVNIGLTGKIEEKISITIIQICMHCVQYDHIWLHLLKDLNLNFYDHIWNLFRLPGMTCCPLLTNGGVGGGGSRLLSRIYFYFILFGTQKHLKIEIH